MFPKNQQTMRSRAAKIMEVEVSILCCAFSHYSVAIVNSTFRVAGLGYAKRRCSGFENVRWESKGSDAGAIGHGSESVAEGAGKATGKRRGPRTMNAAARPYPDARFAATHPS